MEHIAVTGATGFTGKRLVKELINRNYFIHVIARNESRLFQLDDQFKGKIAIFPCLIDDYCLTCKLLTGCSGVYHLASVEHE